jgi:hypothetical protein
MAQKLVAQALSFAGASYQPGYIYESHGSRYDFL